MKLIVILLDKTIEGRYESSENDPTKLVEKRFVYVTLYEFDNAADVFRNDVCKAFPDLHFDFKIFNSLGMQMEEDELFFMNSGEKVYVSPNQFDPSEYLKFYKLQKIG